MELLFISCLFKKSNVATKDIKHPYSCTGSGSRPVGVFVSLVTMCNKDRRRIAFRLPLSCFTQGYNTSVFTDGGIL